ncbi:unnamed protein product [Musa acuminata subsp. burmannicoides]|uniref:(wild Malaysian banana) hypothetical protein n=1 Tax=Musa acuminata subsp. malaccensis TaxID=214687 RepID=A0A804IGI0_MUSAM|nr:PREDICTED: TPR repeat-containing thioredoxin TTL1-like [Musa acuminata subsp. malaccensis]CAG1851342.1 unnamed protein product [Musa acuminata subsp. malaccensis]
MSRPGEPSGRAGRRTELDPVVYRFGSALALREGPGKDKVDDNGGPLGSPVSPLRPRVSAAANTSSSSSSSGSAPGKPPAPASCDTSPTAAADRSRGSKPGHRRSSSGPLIFSDRNGGSGGGSSSASSPLTNVLPAGNICPSGKITGMVPRTTARSDVLGSGTGNYGHGSIVRGGTSGGVPRIDAGTGSLVDPSARRPTASADPQLVTKAGNEQYKRGNYVEALRFYDKAVAMFPGNAACRSNRAAALMGLGRLGEAVRECEEAARLDPANGRVHHRLACLYLRLGQIENARLHIFSTGNQPDPVELQKLQTVERHLGKCGEARKIGDWKSALREADAAIVAGADSSPLLIAMKSEALLRLHQIDEADSALTSSPKFEMLCAPYLNTKFFGMHPEAYVYIVRAQVDVALGRFENAVEVAEKAKWMDSRSIEVAMILNNVKSVVKARIQGNELFKSGHFAEAITAYGEGLKYDPSNPVLLCNRAACRSKLGQWEKSLEDCNQALRIQPSYIKALLRRADSNAKLERWAESVQDYEVLSKELPHDPEVAEALFHAQVALKMSRGEEISNMKFGGEVEEVTSLEQFQAAICLPRASVICFMAVSNQKCSQITPFVNSLCIRYPSANFLKVDVDKSPTVAKAENVRVLPTFKIYKSGTRMKEMICPSQQVLEYSVRHYSL